MTEFAAVKYADWRKLVEGDLKGAAFQARMVTPLCEGIALQPLYTAEDVQDLGHVDSRPGFAPFTRGPRAAAKPWEISQEINCGSPSEFNHLARNSVAGGLDALNMALDTAGRHGADPDWAKPGEVGDRGLSIASTGDLGRALEGIDLKKISLFVRSGASGLPFAALLVALARERKILPRSLRGCIEIDPLGVLSHEGALPQSLDGAYREMAALTGWAAVRAPLLQTICVHGRAWHEAGADFVQELAFVLATGVEYLREMHRRGLEVNAVAPRVRFAVTVGTQFFPEIAKLRALRLLWSKAVATAGGAESAQRLSLHVRTSLWNKTTRGPHNNILRATVESFAAVIGGCDSLQTGPFDEVSGTAGDAGRRLARNTQLILQRECHLAEVADPAGGSWYVERLTHDLAAKAWELFQAIEKRGGMAAAMEAGFPQQAAAASGARKVEAAKAGRAAIVGVNKYPGPPDPAPTAPAGDGGAFYRRRSQQIASHRVALDDEAGRVVLEKLARIVNAAGPDLVGRCADAAVAGATLGEITRALRIHDRPGAPVATVPLTRAAAALEGAPR